MSLTLKAARAVIDAGLEAGTAHNVEIAIAVLDRGGRILAAARSEKASYISLDVATRKAATANMFGAPTMKIMDMVKGDPVLMQSSCADPALSIIPGGLPIMLDGILVGALGVSGGHYTKDHEIAVLALNGLER